MIIEMTVMVVIGISIPLIMKYILKFPFPWEFRLITRGLSQPDALGLAKTFSGLLDGYTIDMVMGNMSFDVCNQEDVISNLKATLERDIKIRIINGPEVDKRSKGFYDLLENPKVELYKYPEFPELHFRVIFEKEKKPLKVYQEAHHRPFESFGFRYATSYQLAKKYSEEFENFLKKSTRCKSIKEFKLIEPSK